MTIKIYKLFRNKKEAKNFLLQIVQKKKMNSKKCIKKNFQCTNCDKNLEKKRIKNMNGIYSKSPKTNSKYYHKFSPVNLK